MLLYMVALSFQVFRSHSKGFFTMDEIDKWAPHVTNFWYATSLRGTSVQTLGIKLSRPKVNSSPYFEMRIQTLNNVLKFGVLLHWTTTSLWFLHFLIINEIEKSILSNYFSNCIIPDVFLIPNAFFFLMYTWCFTFSCR